MRCYHCTMGPRVGGTTFGIQEAVGVCQQCGEAVCYKHAVKAEFYLPSANGKLPQGNRVLMPLLCEDCHEELKKLQTTGKVA
ncbi:MAG: DUF2180 family protein [Chloroflexi bacterium]|nr:DUF2180 family protein [Chloroflexota bacterium]